VWSDTAAAVALALKVNVMAQLVWLLAAIADHGVDVPGVTVGDSGGREAYGAVSDMYECPVCSYPCLRSRPYRLWPPPAGLELRPPYEDLLGTPSYEVCPQCGFEFGNDDNPGTARPMSFDEYRTEWEAEGRPWFDPTAANCQMPEEP
jgi:hypothetical protein